MIERFGKLPPRLQHEEWNPRHFRPDSKCGFLMVHPTPDPPHSLPWSFPLYSNILYIRYWKNRTQILIILFVNFIFGHFNVLLLYKAFEAKRRPIVVVSLFLHYLLSGDFRHLHCGKGNKQYCSWVTRRCHSTWGVEPKSIIIYKSARFAPKLA